MIEGHDQGGVALVAWRPGTRTVFRARRASGRWEYELLSPKALGPWLASGPPRRVAKAPTPIRPAADDSRAFLWRIANRAAKSVRGVPPTITRDDLSVEAYLGMEQAFPQFDPSQGTLEAYLFRCAVNACRDRLRTERRYAARFEQFPEVMNDVSVPLTYARRVEIGEEIEQLLPKRHSQVLQHHLAGRSDIEIGTRFGITAEAVRKLRSRAEKRLRKVA